MSSRCRSKNESGVTYEVHRGTTPGFLPGGATLISANGYALTSFTDSGAASGGPDYYYLVRAVDGDGNPGGVGRQLPDGVGDLILDKSSVTPGNIVLTWNAVTQVFDPAGGGGPTIVDRYEIYASDTPFTREDIRDGALAPLDSTTGTSYELTPASVSRYYSVIVIDNRGNASPF